MCEVTVGSDRRGPMRLRGGGLRRGVYGAETEGGLWG